MNCFNSATYLKEAIESVYAQTFTDWEIIFWDNASTDNSGQVANGFDSKLKYHHGNVTIPLGLARNKAIEKASGEYIAFLDCDDLWASNKLERQIKLFKDQEVDLVFSDVIEFDGTGREQRLYERRPYYTGSCFSALFSDYFLSMPTIVVRRSALEQQPYIFDQNYEVAEEAELFLRLAYTGKLAMVKDVLAKYRVHDGSVTNSKSELISVERMMILEGFKRLYPQFESEHKSEVKRWIRQTKRSEAAHYLKLGKSTEARTVLKHQFLDPKSAVMYIISFLPKIILHFLRRLRGDIR